MLTNCLISTIDRKSKEEKKESQKSACIKRLNSQQTLVKTNKQSIK